MAVVDPPIFINPITPWVFALSQCVCHELSTTGAGPTCWCGIYPGSLISWEYCGECGTDKCGMGYVRVAQGYPSDTFPLATLDPTCRHPLVWTVEVGALRCLPVLEDGEILSPDDMNMLAAEQMQDAHALYRALLCCEAPSVSLQGWQPLGPEGGCVGGMWTAYIGSD